MCTPELKTDRLTLRGWRLSDRRPFADLNADPEVMRHFPARLSRAESDHFVDRVIENWVNDGMCWWAIEAPEGFVGFAGLNVPGFTAAFTPCVEIGWRLARSAWGKGYASEAARAALSWGFNQQRLDEIVSFTVPANIRSRRVMERIGMRHDPDGSFEHPNLPVNHPLRGHVLYRLQRAEWRP